MDILEEVEEVDENENNTWPRRTRVTFQEEIIFNEKPEIPLPSKILYNRILNNAKEVAKALNTIESMDDTETENDRNEILRKNSIFVSQNFHYIKPNKKKRIKFVALKQLKRWTYMMLEKPTGHLAFLYHLFTFFIILISILFGAFVTMEPIKDWAENYLFYIELLVVFYFLSEYCLRVWSCDVLPSYKGFHGKLKFMLKPIMITELLVVVFGAILITASAHLRGLDETDTSTKTFHFGPIALSLLSLLQLVRLLYVDRKASTWLILFDVCNKHRFELISSVYIGFVTLLLSSYLIYHCEKSVPDTLFRTYSDGVYWSIITMTTIGYGDITPKTFYGKIVCTGLCVLGVAFWTLPGGIIGSGFAFKIEQRNKIKKFNRLLPAAAFLIQAWWRMKVIHEIPTDNITRLVNVLKVFEQTDTLDGDGFKTNRERRQSERRNTYLDTYDSSNSNQEERDEILVNMLRKQESKNIEYIKKKVRPKQVIVIRSLLILKFFVAQNKFKAAHKPYDFNDAVKQYTKDNMDILTKIKEVQRRLEQITPLPLPGALNNRAFDPRSSIQLNNLNERKSLISRKLSYLNNAQDLAISTQENAITLESRIESIELKLDQMINLYLTQNTNKKVRKGSVM